jgi:hypothetical protein
VTPRQDSFADLYSRYRIAVAIDRNSRDAGRKRVRRVLFLSSVLLLLGGAAIAEALAAVRVGHVLLWTGLASACTLIALVIMTGFVASEASARREAGRHSNIVAALSSVRPPVPDATEEEVAAWVAQVESILRPALPPNVRE